MKPEYIIYSKQDCNQCNQAEQLLKDKGANYTKLIYNVDFSIIELYEVVPRSVKSFPAITKNGVFIGGLADLKSDLGV